MLAMIVEANTPSLTSFCGGLLSEVSSLGEIQNYLMLSIKCLGSLQTEETSDNYSQFIDKRNPLPSWTVIYNVNENMLAAFVFYSLSFLPDGDKRAWNSSRNSTLHSWGCSYVSCCGGTKRSSDESEVLKCDWWPFHQQGQRCCQPGASACCTLNICTLMPGKNSSRAWPQWWEGGGEKVWGGSRVCEWMGGWVGGAVGVGRSHLESDVLFKTSGLMQNLYSLTENRHKEKGSATYNSVTHDHVAACWYERMFPWFLSLTE